MFKRFILLFFATSTSARSFRHQLGLSLHSRTKLPWETFYVHELVGRDPAGFWGEVPEQYHCFSDAQRFIFQLLPDISLVIDGPLDQLETAVTQADLDSLAENDDSVMYCRSHRVNEDAEEHGWVWFREEGQLYLASSWALKQKFRIKEVPELPIADALNGRFNTALIGEDGRGCQQDVKEAKCQLYTLDETGRELYVRWFVNTIKFFATDIDTGDMTDIDLAQRKLEPLVDAWRDFGEDDLSRCECEVDSFLQPAQENDQIALYPKQKGKCALLYSAARKLIGLK